MEVELPLPIISPREVLPGLGFVPVWGTATDLEPAYEFKRGGIDLRVAQVTGRYLRPEFLIVGVASNGRTLSHIEQSMPLALESSEQIVAWLAFAVGSGFRTHRPIDWLERGQALQHLLPWERARLALRLETEETARLRLLRPHCSVAREDLRQLLNVGSQAAGWPPAPGHFALSFDGEMLKLRARSRIVAVEASGEPWSDMFVGELRHLHALPRRLDGDPIEIGIWKGMLEVGRVRIPVTEQKAYTGHDGSASAAINTKGGTKG